MEVLPPRITRDELTWDKLKQIIETSLAERGLDGSTRIHCVDTTGLDLEVHFYDGEIHVH